MQIKIVTIFPELVESFLGASLVGKAIAAGKLAVEVVDLRSFARDRHRTVDDVPYGGGGGMVMKAGPWLRALRSVAGPDARRVLLSPQGARLDERKVVELAGWGELVLMCGRYEGVDERVRDLVVDEELSIGDYVLAGGEVAAMVVVETVSRQLPGVVGLGDSVENDSFRRGLLDYPHFTRPREIEGREVPEVLLSGDHAAVAAWRRREALRATLEKRPDLLAGAALDDEDRRILAALRGE
ncbi:MAG: tRNA (guanosine(37)-N1)-methyltransferase TrmD [Acidobacteriota bacterium]|nr:tRNA (guanosine(37)-N1)-methyltransferase TrmD [Acidobacteriota bacterium]MDH3525575.1 tRNA (guanosine(37)-N1)-methyltransferase TrmD [Acidobacteriota bacterium]